MYIYRGIKQIYWSSNETEKSFSISDMIFSDNTFLRNIVNRNTILNTT